MNKSIQIAILSLFCFSANTNIAKSALLGQVRDLTITTSKATAEDQDLDPTTEKELTKEDYTRIAFDLCAEHGAEQEALSEIEYHTLEDAKIITIASQVLEDFSHSLFTQPAIIKQLTKSHPTRQDAVQSLESNKAIIKAISESNKQDKIVANFEKIKEYEHTLLELYLTKTETTAIKETLEAKVSYPFPNATKNSITVELYSKLMIVLNIISPIGTLLNIAYPSIVQGFLGMGDSPQERAFARILAAGYTTLVSHASYTTIKNLLNIFNRKQKTLINTNHYLQILKDTASIIEKDPQLAQVFEQELNKINDLFDTSNSSLPKELNELISQLMSNSFSGKATYFSKSGKIAMTWDALEEHKHLLVPYFEILGKIDTHFAVASLYEQNLQNNNPVSICLPEVCYQDRPLIKADKIWHPMINPNVVVPNNVYIGTEGIKQNWIITGPNAGGKTTTITALITNIYFSQNFGIACAESFVYTPFSKVISALDVTTDLSKDESLFKAEAARAKMIKQHALQSNSDQLVFSAIDEPFNGTRADVAAKIAYKYLDQLGNYPYHMAIVTTHLPSLTALENETPNFTNMKVGDAVVNDDKTISYPFTIEQGISTQNIAEAILIEEDVL